jgi:hypothetical protein
VEAGAEGARGARGSGLAAGGGQDAGGAGGEAGGAAVGRDQVGAVAVKGLAGGYARDGRNGRGGGGGGLVAAALTTALTTALLVVVASGNGGLTGVLRILVLVLMERMRETYDRDGLCGSHSDGGGVASLAAAASSLTGGNLNESGSHSGSGVEGDGSLASLALITGALLLVTLNGWGLSLSRCQWSPRSAGGWTHTA